MGEMNDLMVQVICELRDERGWSSSELGRRSGMRPEKITKRLDSVDSRTGRKRELGYEDVVAIAAAFNLKPSDLARMVESRTAANKASEHAA